MTKVIFSKRSRRRVKPCGAQVPFVHSAPRALTLLEFWQKSLICDSAIKNKMYKNFEPLALQLVRFGIKKVVKAKMGNCSKNIICYNYILFLVKKLGSMALFIAAFVTS